MIKKKQRDVIKDAEVRLTEMACEMRAYGKGEKFGRWEEETASIRDALTDLLAFKEIKR